MNLLLICILLAIVPGLSNSQSQPKWIPKGPNGGSFYFITINSHDPSNVLLESFRSADGGITWKRLRHDGLIRSDPLSNRLLRVRYDELDESTDSGISWQKLSLLNPPPDDVRFSNTNPHFLYAMSFQGMHVSRDGGLTWNRRPNVGFHLGAVASFAFGKRAFYVLGDDHTILKSVDEGASWKRIDQGLPGIFVKIVMRPVDVDDEGLYVVGSAGIFRTANGGSSWFQLRKGGFNDISPGVGNTSTLYAVGTYDYRSNHGEAVRSTDGGKTWNPLALPQAWSYLAVAVSPSEPNTVFISAEDRGIFRSVDGGQSWRQVDTGLNALQIRQVFASGNVLITHSDRVMFQSLDGGSSWTTNPMAGLLNKITDITVAPNNPSVFTVNGCCPDGTAIISQDAGKTWAPLGYVGGFLRFDPNDARTFYVLSPPSARKTMDGGRTWSRLGLHTIEPTAFEISPSNPNVLWVGNYGGIVYRSTDGGKKWKATAPVGDSFPVDNLAPDPKNSKIAYVVTSIEPDPLGRVPVIYKTNNGGTSWSLLQEGIENITVDPVNNKTLYTFAGNGVSVSKDDGNTWNLFQMTGLPVPFDIFALALNTTSDSPVIGTARGIYIFTH